MNELNHIQNPTHCFCQFREDELKKWAMERYVNHHSTIELLSQAKSDHEKEVISAVALLDVDEKTMVSIMGNIDMPEHHIIHCRLKVREMLHLSLEKGE